MQKIGEFGGPLLGLIGLWKYRADLYNIFCKRLYRYNDPDIVFVGEQYHKKIPLIKEDTIKLSLIWKNFKA